MKRFVIGDIHGAAKALKDVLDKSLFDYDNDLLICLGDYVDGWSESKEVIDILLNVKNLIPLLGNHDYNVYKFYLSGLKVIPPESFILAYSKETIESFGFDIEQKYLDFFKNCHLYHFIENEKKVFAHASIHPSKSIKNTKDNILWERDIINLAYKNRWYDTYIYGSSFDEIYLGHTMVQHFDYKYCDPQKWGNVYAMDTGSCRTGCISMMDIDTKDVYQSEPSCTYYPNEEGRNQLSLNEAGDISKMNRY